MSEEKKADQQLDRANTTREAFILARDAVGLANEAFFDPSMMGLLYFVSGAGDGSVLCRIEHVMGRGAYCSPTSTSSRCTRRCSRRLGSRWS